MEKKRTRRLQFSSGWPSDLSRNAGSTTGILAAAYKNLALVQILWAAVKRMVFELSVVAPKYENGRCTLSLLLTSAVMHYLIYALVLSLAEQAV